MVIGSAMRKKGMADRLNWGLLHTFLAIVEEKSLSKAALRLHLTQSAVSQSLKKLEQQVGQKLLHRSSQVFELTPVGEACYKVACSMYGEVAGINTDEDGGEESITGNIKLQIVSRIYNQRYNDFLASFQKRHPKVNFEVEVLKGVNIIHNLSQKVPAIGICLARHEMPNLNRIELYNQRYGLYCGFHHPLFNQEHIDLDDVRSQNFVAFQSEQIGDVLSPLAVFKDEHRFNGQISCYTNDMDEVVRMLYAGFGIGCLPRQLGSAAHLQHILRVLPPFDGVVNIPVYVMWHQARALSAAEQCFLQEIQEAKVHEQPDMLMM